MTFIEAPSFVDGDVIETHLLQNVVQRLSCPLQERRVGYIECEPLVAQSSSRTFGFLNAFITDQVSATYSFKMFKICFTATFAA